VAAISTSRLYLATRSPRRPSPAAARRYWSPRRRSRACGPGSVLVDTASGPLGGNVALSEPDITVITGDGVTIVGAGVVVIGAMTIAATVTTNYGYALAAVAMMFAAGTAGAVGAVAGVWEARAVKMTAMPQLVSVFNAVGGGAAALVFRGGRLLNGVLIALILGSGAWLAARPACASSSAAVTTPCPPLPWNRTLNMVAAASR
jgi:hypothetical protein